MIPICLVLLALAVLPTAMTILNLLALKIPELAPPRTRVAILVPARDEEEGIAACLESALASTGVDVEVVMLDDNSRDATAAIATAIAARDTRLRVVTAPSLPPGWSGKQHACSVLSSLTDAPYLLFVDADVRLAPEAAARLAGALAATDLVSGVPRQVMETLAEMMIIPMINVLLLGYLPIPLSRRDGRPALGAACGQLIAVRAEAYRKAGGHAGIRASLHDGLRLPQLFRCAGLRTDLVAGAGLASCRMYVGWRAVVQGTLKNATEGMARPIALPVWTLLLLSGHVMPWIAFAVAVAEGLRPAAFIAGLACALPLAARAAQAWRCREPWASVPLHPMAITFLLGLQWLALGRRWAGRTETWRGRSYPSAR